MSKETIGADTENTCPHCEFIERTFEKIETNYDYWLVTETFVYLHNGNDYCDWKEKDLTKTK